MRGRIITTVTVSAVAVMIASVGTLAAQDHQHPQAGQQAESGAMMRGMPMPGPAMMLMHREQLGLSDAQVQRLESLAARQHQAMQRHMPQAMRAMADLMEAASGEIDVDAARAAHDRMARVHSEMLVANLQAMKEARQVLTPEQRTRWNAMMATMGGPMQMMGPMMMMMGPMMQRQQQDGVEMTPRRRQEQQHRRR